MDADIKKRYPIGSTVRLTWAFEQAFRYDHRVLGTGELRVVGYEEVTERITVPVIANGKGWKMGIHPDWLISREANG
jgi:hypothetical protein